MTTIKVRELINELAGLNPDTDIYVLSSPRGNAIELSILRVMKNSLMETKAYLILAQTSLTGVEYP